MPIEFTCAVCKREIRVADGTEGKRTKCPHCQAVMLIPGGEGDAMPAGPQGGFPGGGQGTNTFSDIREDSWNDPNSYGSPAGSSPPSSAARKREARERIGAPSIVCMALIGVTMVFSILWYLLMVVFLVAELDGELAELMPDTPAETIGNLIGGVIGLALSVLALVGLNQARQVKGYSMAWTGFILAALPCTTSCCCIFSLPIAIWGMVVLADAEVKRAFELPESGQMDSPGQF